MQWSICSELSKPWKKIYELPSLLLEWAVLAVARLEGKGLHSLNIAEKSAGSENTNSSQKNLMRLEVSAPAHEACKKNISS